MKFKALFVALALSSAPAASAHATMIWFDITGSGGDPSAVFELPQNPSPDVILPSLYFGFFSVPAGILGSPYQDLFGLDFWNIADGGGLSDQTYYDLVGPQLFTGRESNPTFVPGVYSNMYNEATGNTDIVTLTVVPEASVWAMMLVGFIGLGLARYRGRRVAGAAKVWGSEHVV